MNLDKIFTKKRVIFIGIFTLLVLIGKNINFSSLVGADKQFFTLFQFFGPIAGAFIGSIFGVIAVLFAQLIDFIVVGKEASLINILRLTPMLFAAYYFSTKKKNFGIAVSLLAIGAFILHPVGRQVWFFSLFWTIPIIVKLLPNKYSNGVMVRSFGSTFTAHAVGGALWIWTIPMTAGQWIALIPVVIVERTLFAAGIGISYVTINALIDKVVDKFKMKIPSSVLRINKRFTIKA